MPWMWLFTAAVVLTLGPSWGRPAHAAECGAWHTGEFFKTAAPERVRACLAAGADPKARDKDGMTPLHLAAAYAHRPQPQGWLDVITATPAVITALVTAGADPTARAENGTTPLLASPTENRHSGRNYRPGHRRGRPHGAGGRLDAPAVGRERPPPRP